MAPEYLYLISPDPNRKEGVLNALKFPVTFRPAPHVTDSDRWVSNQDIHTIKELVVANFPKEVVAALAVAHPNLKDFVIKAAELVYGEGNVRIIPL